MIFKAASVLERLEKIAFYMKLSIKRERLSDLIDRWGNIRV